MGEKSAKPTFEAFLKVFKNDLKSYAVGYEVVIEAGAENHHIHCHLEYLKYDETTYSKRRQRLIKSLKEAQHVPDKNGAQYHEKLDKTRFQNLRYCLKGKNIISHNLTAEELEEVAKDNERIEAEKSKSMKEQLYENWIGQSTRIFLSKGEAFQFIDEYHVERDYLPPTNSLLTQYSKFILIKQYKAMKDPTIHIKIIYHKVLNELNGIRAEQEQYAEITAVKAMDEATRRIDKMVEPHKKKFDEFLIWKSINNDAFIDSDSEHEINHCLDA